MWSATASTKCCATCANWGGERKVSAGGLTAEAPHTDTKGKCYEGVYSSCTQGHSACQGRSCSKYRKWGALR